MAPRLELQTLLESLLGSRNVYFQPGTNLQMEYPCIRYDWDDEDKKFADNVPYVGTRRYILMHIDSDPDSVIPKALSDLPLSRFNRRYVADNLYHTLYYLYF